MERMRMEGLENANEKNGKSLAGQVGKYLTFS
jgi:hypothetical protein